MIKTPFGVRYHIPIEKSSSLSVGIKDRTMVQSKEKPCASKEVFTNGNQSVKDHAAEGRLDAV